MVSTRFQPRFGEDQYPIGRFILDRVRALGITRSDLVHRLGYRNTANGHKALAETLKTGALPAHLRKHLSGALELDEAVIASVIESTARQQQDEWRAWLLDREKEHITHFRPHLRTETARTVPEPIFIAALIGTARL